MKAFMIISLPLIFLTGSSSSHGSTILVPAEFPTIQEAIVAASDGDSILVSHGTYRETIDFLGKAVTVKSEDGPYLTTINGGGLGSVVSFRNGESRASVIEGFSITNGAGTLSGPYTYGGGIYCWFSMPTIIGNVIRGNSANYHGGGIYCLSSDSALIVGNVIRGNRAHNGGGIYCSAQSNPTIMGNSVFGNYAELDGGGIFCNWGSNPVLINNTITDNSAGYGGGGIYCYSSSPVVVSSILWNNSAPEGPEAYLGDWLYPSTLTIDYSDMEGGESSVFVDSQCLLDWGIGMIDSDPVFVMSEMRDYRLLWESPCIDTAHPVNIDPDGTRSDMGAHFFDQDDYLTIYLTPHPVSVSQGAELRVTYTSINRNPVSETFWLNSKIYLPNGAGFDILGPLQFTQPANTTVQNDVIHIIPSVSPPINYRYWTGIGNAASQWYDIDDFYFCVTRYPAIHTEPIEF